LTLHIPVQRPPGMLRMSKFTPGEFVMQAILGLHPAGALCASKPAPGRFV